MKGVALSLVDSLALGALLNVVVGRGCAVALDPTDLYGRDLGFIMEPPAVPSADVAIGYRRGCTAPGVQVIATHRFTRPEDQIVLEDRRGFRLNDRRGETVLVVPLGFGFWRVRGSLPMYALDFRARTIRSR